MPPQSPELTPIVVPDFGTHDTPLKISNWLVERGDTVVQGDALVELLFPGITCDISAPVSGTIERLTKEVDALVRQGDTVGWITPDLVVPENSEE